MRHFVLEVTYTERLFIFEGLTDTEKQKIANIFSPPRTFKKGEVIYSADSFENAIGYVLSGKAFAVCDNDSGLRMKAFESGSCFGAAAVFGGSDKYVSTIIAETDIEVLFITEAQLREIFLKVPKTAVTYINFLSEKVRFLNKKLSLLSCGSSEDTVFRYLTSSADSDGFVHTPKNMTLLSKTLGIGRATLYRCLDNLESQGFIIRENNKIKVIKNEKIS